MTKQTRQAIIVSCAMLLACLAAVVVGINWNFLKAEYYFKFGNSLPNFPFSPPLGTTTSSRTPLEKLLLSDVNVRNVFLRSRSIGKFLVAAGLATDYESLTTEEKRLVVERCISLLKDTRPLDAVLERAEGIVGVPPGFHYPRICDFVACYLWKVTGQLFGVICDNWWPPAGFTFDAKESAEAIAQWKQWFDKNKDGELFQGVRKNNK